MPITRGNLEKLVQFRNESSNASNLQFETDCASAGIYTGELGVPRMDGKVTSWSTPAGNLVEDRTRPYGKRYYLKG